MAETGQIQPPAQQTAQPQGVVPGDQAKIPATPPPAPAEPTPAAAAPAPAAPAPLVTAPAETAAATALEAKALATEPASPKTTATVVAAAQTAGEAVAEPTMVNGMSVVGMRLNAERTAYEPDPDYAAAAGRPEDIFDRIGRAFSSEPQRLVLEELALRLGLGKKDTTKPLDEQGEKSKASLRQDAGE